MQERRAQITSDHFAPASNVLERLSREAPLDDVFRARASARAVDLVRAIRADKNPGLMEVFLAEYGLSTREGVALMCLAEALLRVPDPQTIDALIEDKIAPSAWGEHLGKSSSPLVNASTWALMLTGKVLKEEDGTGIAATLHSTMKRLGEPVIRSAVGRAIREMGHQFVLGRTIDEALARGQKLAEAGYRFSYDMLGEAALTEADAKAYFAAYMNAIKALSPHATNADIRDNPGLSVKLSALHPRYETAKSARVMAELVPTTRDLARAAAAAGMGFNIDAEEAGRLDLSLDVIEAVLSDSELADWQGFGVVVQAYGKRAGAVLDWLYALAEKLDRKIMVRLVKGAYWDAEIKRAQVDGLLDFPVFTHKSHTDMAYILCAKKLLGMGARIYPQFATHNAHTVAAILEMAPPLRGFEFQRLQGMGESLHARVMAAEGTRCRIYAPVGTHRDLLAYLVRRLLENGANSSFVNQIVDKDVAAEVIAADPFAIGASLIDRLPAALARPVDLFAPARRNSAGFDLDDRATLARIDAARDPFKTRIWSVGPLISGPTHGEEIHQVVNPAIPTDRVGDVREAAPEDVQTALAAARNWTDVTPAERARVLVHASQIFEENFGEFFAILCREAGKTPRDAVSELREAVDFLRYYAAECVKYDDAAPAGIFACISPWNFPLAIFTGQIAAALAMGNGVLAKPAEPSMITAAIAVRLLHKAGVPQDVLQFLPGKGAVVGAAITSDLRINGVCFTGSTATARRINRSMAENLAPAAPLIAETGGLNAMIVDSTALPEQAISDILTSAFQSAGQRCSALRILYLQDEIYDDFLTMLFGAMDQLQPGDPWQFATDLGPVISAGAQQEIGAYVAEAAAKGRLLKQIKAPKAGHFIAPAVIGVSGIGDLSHEVFGPVLHVARFRAEGLDDVVNEVNRAGYGLTFGMHSRIDDRVARVTARLRVGNIYINRNQIGAVVGSQPFGGEGLSGTGPKAGGPGYLPRFAKTAAERFSPVSGAQISLAEAQDALDHCRPVAVPAPLSTTSLPGPTGESNRLSTYPRGTVLCLGPGREAATAQRRIAEANGCAAFVLTPGWEGDRGLDGALPLPALSDLGGFDLLAFWSEDPAAQHAVRVALSRRKGAILALAQGRDDLAHLCRVERHVCIDTTASGGNARLLADVGRAFGGSTP